MNKRSVIKRKTIYGALVLAVVLTLINGCNAENEPLKIGVVGTLSGAQSDLSVSGRRGIEIAVEAINNSGGIHGHPIQLVVKNDENDPKRAVEIVKEFAGEGVSCVIGHYTSGMTMAAYDEMLRHDIVYLSPTATVDDLVSVDDHLIRLMAPTIEQAQLISEAAFRDGHQRFVVIYDLKNEAYTKRLYENFRDLLTLKGGEVIGVYGYETLNESAVAKYVRDLTDSEEPIDGILVITDPVDLALIAKAIKKSEIDSQLYSSVWAHTNDLIRVGGVHVNGVKVVGAVDHRSEGADFKDFQETYLRRYGQQASFSSVYAYEALMVLVKVMKEQDYPMDFETLRQQIGDAEYDGLQGPFYIDRFGDRTNSFLMHEIVDDEFKRID